MDPRTRTFLDGVMGPDGARALERTATQEPGLGSVLTLRAALAWCSILARAQLPARIPGTGDEFSLRKTDGGYEGEIGGRAFRDQPLVRVAAMVSDAVGDPGCEAPRVRGESLRKLGKAIDLLVQSHHLPVLQKAVEDQHQPSAPRRPDAGYQLRVQKHLRGGGVTVFAHRDGRQVGLALYDHGGDHLVPAGHELQVRDPALLQRMHALAERQTSLPVREEPAQGENLAKMAERFSDDSAAQLHVEQPQAGHEVHRASDEPTRGVWHHVYESAAAPGWFMHVLSRDSKPFGRAVASVHGALHRNHPETGSPGPWFQASVAATDPEMRGTGLGTLLLSRALAHHGQMVSDRKISATHERTWQKLLGLPGVEGEMAPTVPSGTVDNFDGEPGQDHEQYENAWKLHWARMKKGEIIAKADSKITQAPAQAPGKPMGPQMPSRAPQGPTLAAPKPKGTNSTRQKAPGLQKVMLNPSSEADRIAPHGLGSHPGASGVQSEQLPSGLWHHIEARPMDPRSTVVAYHHVLSTSADPHDHNGVLGSIQGAVRDLTDPDDVPWTRAFQVGTAGVWGDEQGKGYGTQLYYAALRHHKRMVSDIYVSKKASGAWAKLHTMPGVRGALAPEGPDNQDRHWAEYTGQDPEKK